MLAVLPATPALHVTPSTVVPGGTITISGTTAGGCARRDVVILISRLFPGHAYGEGAITARQRRGGRFRRTFVVPHRKPLGVYGITARCGGGNLGVKAKLSVARYALLARSGGLRVYGPPRHGPPPCPQALPLPHGALAIARRAVTLAMPPFEARLNLNGRDPIVHVAQAVRSGYVAAAGGCGRLAWRRSVVATVRLPHVAGASMSHHTFGVARIRAGWVLWAWIH
jgi:hypothetical protein